MITSGSGLKYVFIKRGKGRRPKAGDLVTIHYTGSFLDGTVFATTRAPGCDLYSFTLGQDSLIKGAEEAIRLMNVGSRATFTMPPRLAYGEKGKEGIIPPDATLVFDYEIISVRRKKLRVILVERIKRSGLRTVLGRIRSFLKKRRP